MTNFKITHESLHYLKGLLTYKLPGAKSSHISEAMAASAGFRTHAAMVACLESSPEKSCDVAMSEARMRERLAQLSHIVSEDFNLPDLVSMVLAPGMPNGLFERISQLSGPRVRVTNIVALGPEYGMPFFGEPDDTKIPDRGFGTYCATVSIDNECFEGVLFGDDNEQSIALYGYGAAIDSLRAILPKQVRFLEYLAASASRYQSELGGLSGLLASTDQEVLMAVIDAYSLARGLITEDEAEADWG